MLLVLCAAQCSLSSALDNAPCPLRCTMLPVLCAAQCSLSSALHNAFCPMHSTIFPVLCIAQCFLSMERPSGQNYSLLMIVSNALQMIWQAIWQTISQPLKFECKFNSHSFSKWKLASDYCVFLQQLAGVVLVVSEINKPYCRSTWLSL